MSKTVVIALADRDFDPTEAAVPWKVLTDGGVEVVFATEAGTPGACDPLMLEGGAAFGTIKATRANADAYRAMAETSAFRSPITYADIDPTEHAALVLPGGHAPGMRQYLEAVTLQEKVALFMREERPVAAICHGGVVLARARHAESGHPVLAGRTMTALPKRMEWSAWAMTFATRGNYFRTYPTWVRDEVLEALGPEGRFEGGPLVPSYGNPFTVRDRNLLTARWPGDAQRFAEELLEMLG